MKRIIITLAVIVSASVLASAQDKTHSKNYTLEGRNFTQQKGARSASSSDTPTIFTWTDSKGNTYPIYLHTYTRGEKAGRTTCYVIKTSAKTGKEYKYYLPQGEEIAREIMASGSSSSGRSI